MAELTASTRPSAQSSVADRAARVRFRRALALMAMTLVAPGSAQLVAGNRKVGRIALADLARVDPGRHASSSSPCSSTAGSRSGSRPTPTCCWCSGSR